MRARVALALGGALIALSLAGCGRAGDAGFAACEGARDDATFEHECSKVIDAGKASPQQLAYAHMYRGSARQRQGQGQAAIADLDASIRLLPQDAKLLVVRSALHGMQGHPELALVDSEAATKLDPKDINALGNLAVALEQTGQFRRSRDVARRGLEVDPKNANMAGELCWVGAVVGDQLEEALADCNTAIEIAPVPNNFNSRGFAFYRLGRFEEAIADYSHALEKEPNVASSWLVRGLAKRAAGLEGAQEDIDKGNALDPKVAARFASYGIKVE